MVFIGDGREMKVPTMKDKRELACMICRATGKQCDNCVRPLLLYEPTWLDRMLHIAESLMEENVRVVHEPNEFIISNEEYCSLINANNKLKEENKRLNEKQGNDELLAIMMRRFEE